MLGPVTERVRVARQEGPPCAMLQWPQRGAPVLPAKTCFAAELMLWLWPPIFLPVTATWYLYGHALVSGTAGGNDAIPYFQRLIVSRVSTVEINALFPVHRSRHLVTISCTPPLLIGSTLVAVLPANSWFNNPGKTISLVPHSPRSVACCRWLHLLQGDRCT
jgi:hypothetical protein